MKRLGLIGSAMILLCTFIVGWEQSGSIKADDSTRQVVEAAAPLLEDSFSVTLKWSGTTEGYSSDASFRELFNNLTQQLEINTGSSIEEVNGLPILHSLTLQTDGSEAQSILAGSADQQSSFFILKLQSTHPVNLEHLIQWQQDMASKLSAGRLKGAWNTMIQGVVKDDALKEAQPNNLLADVLFKLQGHSFENYTDEHTQSISFYTSMLGAPVQSGQHRINAQAALHQDSVSRAWRLTLGTPLITMEY